MLLAEEKYEDAVCLYESLLKEKKDEAVSLRMAFALFKAKKYARAIQVLEALSKEDPDVLSED